MATASGLSTATASTPTWKDASFAGHCIHSGESTPTHTSGSAPAFYSSSTPMRLRRIPRRANSAVALISCHSAAIARKWMAPADFKSFRCWSLLLLTAKASSAIIRRYGQSGSPSEIQIPAPAGNPSSGISTVTTQLPDRIDFPCFSGWCNTRLGRRENDCGCSICRR